jgi:hypothetical protein
MDRCPKCGKYFLSFNPIAKEVICFNTGCNYREKDSTGRYERENDLLPKLSESIKLQRLL